MFKALSLGPSPGCEREGSRTGRSNGSKTLRLPGKRPLRRKTFEISRGKWMGRAVLAGVCGLVSAVTVRAGTSWSVFKIGHHFLSH